MGNRRNIVIMEQQQIEVYAGDTGFIVIKQINPMDEDDFIFIDPVHVDAICAALQAAKTDAAEARKEWMSEGGNEPA